MLKAIFYARFHPERGPSVIHQYPINAIVASGSSGERSLLRFQDVSSYLIPPYELCNRPLSISANGYRLLGFPVSLEDSKYARNRFTFNVCFVLHESEDARPWEQIVRKTARFFQALEEEDGILQAEEQLANLKWAGDESYPMHNIGVVYTILETMLEELSAYSEACVGVDDFHVLNLRLASPRMSPPKVKAWDVPLLIRPLPSYDEWTWDLTLQRIHSHIDGVKHVRRIAELADVELKLVKKAVRELLYHERAAILDIFHFKATYAPTAELSWFVMDDSMQNECCEYVATAPVTSALGPRDPELQGGNRSTSTMKQALVDLYRNLSPEVSLQDLCIEHEPQLSNVDIRRFITFGILKGFVRRIHKYALAIDAPSASSQPIPPESPVMLKSKSSEDAAKEIEKAWKQAAISSGWPTPPMAPLAENMEITSLENPSDGQLEEDMKLRAFLDGRHCMDEICVFMHLSEKEILKRLHSGRFGEVVLFCK